MKGFVYVMNNPTMPGIVKIGRTTGCCNKRAEQLYNTSVPVKFSVIYTCETNDCVYLEKMVHERLDQDRVSNDREYFRCSPSIAIKTIGDASLELTDAVIIERLTSQVRRQEKLISKLKNRSVDGDLPVFVEVKGIQAGTVTGFHSRLRASIERSGLKKSKIIEDLNLKSRSGLKKWTDGEGMPDAANALRLADLLGVDPQWLVLGVTE